MKDFIKPKVIISKCIEFDHCRWNGQIIRSPLVELLKTYVDFEPVCAEVEIGLGVPRISVRIVKHGNDLKLIQGETQTDLTRIMNEFCDNFLELVKEMDGFILKSKSPSCGIFQTKHYSGIEKGAAVISKGAGFFGRAVIQKFSDLAIETEARLRNFRIREHWLIKIYTIANFHHIKTIMSMHELVEYHTKNKLLFMAYNQDLMRELGKIVANHSKLSLERVIESYEYHLFKLLNRPPNYTSHINTLMHAFGYISKDLSHQEKAFFLDELAKYRSGWVPLFTITKLLDAWIVRFAENYLKKQTYFNPYPEELMTFDIRDTWRGRSYWEKDIT